MQVAKLPAPQGEGERAPRAGAGGHARPRRDFLGDLLARCLRRCHTSNLQAQVHLKSRTESARCRPGTAPTVPIRRRRSRTLQSWRPKPRPPTCASRRGPCPTPRACTSGAPPRARCSTSARPPRCSKRVASYFASVNRDRKSEELVARAASIEPIVVASASEALLLEQQLIKRHRPPLNARLRDDKSYPYIAVTLADEYPRVLFTRERHRHRRALLRPLRVGAEGAHDARDAQQDLPVPALRGAGAGHGARACPASITTSAAAPPPASG